MPGTGYVGKAGHLAVMGELCLRGYNVAMPEIDKGDDVFVVNDETGAMWRLQVKTSQGRSQQTSRRFQFRIKESAIQSPQTPELHFIFVMRAVSSWRFLVMDRAVLMNYTAQGVGTLDPMRNYRQVSVTVHDDGRAICSRMDLSHHLENWSTWPEL